MGKPKTAAQGATPDNSVVVRYNVLAPKRPLGTATKHGVNATSGTHAALAAAAQANGGTLTYAEAHAICAAQQDKGFARYAMRRGWLVTQTA